MTFFPYVPEGSSSTVFSHKFVQCSFTICLVKSQQTENKAENF